MQDPIVVENLVKSYALLSDARPFDILLKKIQTILVLDDISFSVPKGEILGVMGNNGAGKSTLLRVLGKVYSHDSGKVAVRGTVSSLFEMGSFMNLYMTGKEYCREYLFLMSDTKVDYDAVIKEVAEFTELGPYFDEPINTYSSGMMAKLLFALATAFPAEVYLIDEILVVGDLYFRGKAWKRMRGLLGSGVSGILVTHEWESVLKLCKNTVILENHKLGYSGSTYEMVRQYLGVGAEKIVSTEIMLADEQAVTTTTFRAESGCHFRFVFDIDVVVPPEKGKLGIYFYVGQFSVGLGWNVVFIFDKTVQLTKPGHYAVAVEIPDFPLAPGDYLAAIELVTPLEEGEQVFSNVYTRLNWLNGNPIPLQVSGSNPEGTILSGGFVWDSPNTM